MILRVLQDGFLLAIVGIEVGILGVDSVPVVAFQDAVVIGGRYIVAQFFSSLVSSGDIPSLRVVVSCRLIQIVRHPRGEVIVGKREKSCHVVLASNHAQEGVAYALVETF